MKKNIIISLVIIVIAFILLLYLKLHLLYYPLSADPVKYDKFYKKISLLSDSTNNLINNMVETSDDVLIDTLYINNADSNICIIYFPGNYGNMSMRFEMIKFLHNFASVLIFDYRSYGKSRGDRYDLSCYSTELDAMAVWQYTVEKLKYKPNNISFFGESIGCSVAIHLAATLSKNLDTKFYPHSLILNSPFYSLSSMMDYTFEKINIGIISIIVSYIIGWEYRSDVEIKKINHITKIIIAHSPRDEIIPFSQAYNLYRLISLNHKNSKFITINGTHNNIGLTDEYMYALADIFS